MASKTGWHRYGTKLRHCHCIYRVCSQVQRDLSNPSEGLVKFVQLMTDQKFAASEVRAAIDDIFSQPNMNISMSRLAIFAKGGYRFRSAI